MTCRRWLHTAMLRLILFAMCWDPAVAREGICPHQRHHFYHGLRSIQVWLMPPRLGKKRFPCGTHWSRRQFLRRYATAMCAVPSSAKGFSGGSTRANSARRVCALRVPRAGCCSREEVVSNESAPLALRVCQISLQCRRVLSSLLRNVWQVVRRPFSCPFVVCARSARTRRHIEWKRVPTVECSVGSCVVSSAVLQSAARRTTRIFNASTCSHLTSDARRQGCLSILVRVRRSAFDTLPCTSVRCLAHFVQRCWILRKY
mmetsp:Transcript_2280/g.6574  ORF Transcript_2280/g.6574 Transcript_2280/m.6574 type:complete len:259 (-) Transcript_2280:138-914(-)